MFAIKITEWLFSLKSLGLWTHLPIVWDKVPNKSVFWHLPLWRLMRQRLIICFCYKPSNPLNPSKLTSPPNCLARPSKTGTADGFAWEDGYELKTLPPTLPLRSIFLKRPGREEARPVGEVQGGLQAAAEKEVLLLVQTSFPFASSSFPHLKALSKKLISQEQNSDCYLQRRG